MTIDELYIQLDIHSDNKIDFLKKYSSKCYRGYFFVDSLTGDCYLFDKDGNKDDIKKIKKIYDYLFERNENLKTIKIPDSVTNIGLDAFWYCCSLTHIMIPNTVTSIGRSAFSGCSRLTSVTIPDSIKSIGNWMFYNCGKLTNVTISSNIKNIGYNVFNYCNNLKEVIFKNKTIDEVKSMKNYPFGIKDESIIKCI